MSFVGRFLLALTCVEGPFSQAFPERLLCLFRRGPGAAADSSAPPTKKAEQPPSSSSGGNEAFSASPSAVPSRSSPPLRVFPPTFSQLLSRPRPAAASPSTSGSTFVRRKAPPPAAARGLASAQQSLNDAGEDVSVAAGRETDASCEGMEVAAAAHPQPPSVGCEGVSYESQLRGAVLQGGRRRSGSRGASPKCARRGGSGRGAAVFAFPLEAAGARALACGGSSQRSAFETGCLRVFSGARSSADYEP